MKTIPSRRDQLRAGKGDKDDDEASAYLNFYDLEDPGADSLQENGQEKKVAWQQFFFRKKFPFFPSRLICRRLAALRGFPGRCGFFQQLRR
jgi:hypothetical protein